MLTLSPRDAFTIRDACEGVQIFGGIGSGKTSGSGAALARSMLLAGFGALVCCAKPEESALWQAYAAETGREQDLVIIRPGARGEPPPYSFNFLHYELSRTSEGGGLTENVVSLLAAVVEIVEGRQEEASDGGFWKRGMNELLRNAVDILALTGDPLTLDAVCKLILDAPPDLKTLGDTAWHQNSSLMQAMVKAQPNALTARQKNDYDRAGSYWMRAYPEMPERTRGGIVATFRGVSDMLLHGLAWELLANTTNIVPEITFRDGAIIVLDLPIQEFREVGRVVQGIWKLMYQQAILRRNPGRFPRPSVLWCDESQYFVSPFDYEYQSTARSARACTVYLTQNISNYRARLGSNAEAQADSLLGLFSTKIFHSNGDAATNQYAADLIGQEWQTTFSFNTNTSPEQPGGSRGAGGSESVQYQLLPAKFTSLRTGGPANGRQVQGVIVKAGRVWRQNGKTFLPVTFTQPL